MLIDFGGKVADTAITVVETGSETFCKGGLAVLYVFVGLVGFFVGLRLPHPFIFLVEAVLFVVVGLRLRMPPPSIFEGQFLVGFFDGLQQWLGTPLLDHLARPLGARRAWHGTKQHLSVCLQLRWQNSWSCTLLAERLAQPDANQWRPHCHQRRRRPFRC
jgi:hypothetical protein